MDKETEKRLEDFAMIVLAVVLAFVFLAGIFFDLLYFLPVPYYALRQLILGLTTMVFFGLFTGLLMTRSSGVSSTDVIEGERKIRVPRVMREYKVGQYFVDKYGVLPVQYDEGGPMRLKICPKGEPYPDEIQVINIKDNWTKLICPIHGEEISHDKGIPLDVKPRLRPMTEESVRLTRESTVANPLEDRPSESGGGKGPKVEKGSLATKVGGGNGDKK